MLDVIPEEARNRTDYRLLVTCPVVNYVNTGDGFSLLVLLEMD